VAEKFDLEPRAEAKALVFAELNQLEKGKF
jgi:hypothetical protein